VLCVVSVTVPPALPPFRAIVAVPAVAAVTVPVTLKVCPTAGGGPVHDTIVGTSFAGTDAPAPPAELADPAEKPMCTVPLVMPMPVSS
jgi:hypothetical protein